MTTGAFVVSKVELRRSLALPDAARAIRSALAGATTTISAFSAIPICLSDQYDYEKFPCPTPYHYEDYDYNLFSNHVSVWRGNGEGVFNSEEKKQWGSNQSLMLIVACDNGNRLPEGLSTFVNFGLRYRISGENKDEELKAELFMSVN